MKKLLSKLRRKKHFGAQGDVALSLRITNETVAEHRERILAGGRKFKYPLQYPKYRIVIVTTVLVVLSLILLLGVALWALYDVQDTSDITLHITQVLPFPVGEIDGEKVPYSDYLSQLRSALHYLSTKEAVNFSSDDGKHQLEYQKRLALNMAIENAYVSKLARLNNVTVSDQELNSFIQKEIANNNLGVTESMYQQVIKDYYDWTFDDYRASVKNQLLRKKVEAKVDSEGRTKIDAAMQQLRDGKNFSDIAKAFSEDPVSQPNGGDIGVMTKTTDDPNGLYDVALKLPAGQTSGVIEGVDGFYIIRLLDKNGGDLHIAKIYVSYKTFANNLAALKKAGKVKEYITVSQMVNPTNK